MTQDQCVFIRGFRVKCVFFWIRPIQIESDSVLVTATAAGTIKCKWYECHVFRKWVAFLCEVMKKNLDTLVSAGRLEYRRCGHG
jgi:hypothetical protein